jgi:hypothetical protein
MNCCRRKLAIRSTCKILVWLAVSSPYAAGQADSSLTACPSTEAVLQHYVDALGGEVAIGQIETRLVKATAVIISPAPFPFAPPPSSPKTHLEFHWRAPNKVTVTGYSPSGFPIKGSKSTWRFDGKLWYSPEGVDSEENATHRGMQYQINMMYRLAANPLMIAGADRPYSSFEADDRPATHPGLCILRSYRPGIGIFAFESSSSCADCRAPITDSRLPDELYFDAQSGLLKKWKTHEGWTSPGSVEFEFDDYRQTGTVKIPFSVHVSFGILQATFIYTKVEHNVPLENSTFASRKHCTTLLCGLLGLNPQ